MACQYNAGHDFGAKLARAVGLDPDQTPITRIVIDCNINSLVMVYVQMPLATGDAVPETLAELVADECVKVVPVRQVDVDPDGTVRVKR